MKTRLTITAAILFGLAFVAVSHASGPAAIWNPDGGAIASPPSREDVVWYQAPSYWFAYESTDDLGGDLDVWIVDDFAINFGTIAITSLDWAGGPFFDQPLWFVITFYEMLPGCEGPDDESLIISEQIIYEYTAWPAEWLYDYHAQIEPVVLSEGQYWVSIRGAVNLEEPGNGWIWMGAEDEWAWGCDPMLRAPRWDIDVFTPLTDINPNFTA